MLRVDGIISGRTLFFTEPGSVPMPLSASSGTA